MADGLSGCGRGAPVSGRPTFGLLVDWLEDEYQNEVLAGVEDAAVRLGVNLLVFAGGVVESEDRGAAQRNFAFDLAGPHNVAGLVVMAGAIGNRLGAEQLSVYCQKYRPLSMCSVGVQLDGMPCVLTDNRRGMHDLIVHLLQVHGYRRIAFIRGPRANTEAEGRYRVYCEVLSEYGIPHDPELVTDGDFHLGSGVAAIRTLLDERRVQFDAVAAAADTMALGALDALTSRGVRVPYDVAVVGFDDIEAARFASPTLTSVRQPLRDQGAYALQTVLAQSRGESVEMSAVLRAQLSVRQSCGCPARVALPLLQHDWAPSEESLLTTLDQRRSAIVRDMSRAMRSLSGSLEVGWGERLLDALGAELRREPEGVFGSTLDELVTTVAVLGGNVNAWQGAISALRRHALACSASDSDAVARSEELWHQARVAVGGIAERAQAQHRLEAAGFTRVLRHADGQLSSATTPDVLGRVIAAEMPRLRIPSCHVALFVGGRASRTEAQLCAAYRASGLPEGVAVGDRFDALRLAPPGLEAEASARRCTRVVQPLFGDEGPLGFAVLELGPHDGAISEQIRDQINRSLNVARVVRQTIDRAIRHDAATTLRSGQELAAAMGASPGVVAQTASAPGLRVAAASIPVRAADYHDVLPVADGCWLGVGEVSLPDLVSGELAAMLRGAVAGVVTYRQGVAPCQVVRTLNAVVFEHLRARLPPETSARLTLVHCDPTGRMVYAGAYEDIIVCRAADGQCTRLRTPGTRIGAVRDIDRVTSDTHCQLDEGDLVVLFTHGAIAATSEDGEQYGLDRLCSQVERTRLLPVAQVRDQLIASLDRFQARWDQDVSVIVARHGVADATVAIDVVPDGR